MQATEHKDSLYQNSKKDQEIFVSTCKRAWFILWCHYICFGESYYFETDFETLRQDFETLRCPKHLQDNPRDSYIVPKCLSKFQTSWECQNEFHLSEPI